MLESVWKCFLAQADLWFVKQPDLNAWKCNSMEKDAVYTFYNSTTFSKATPLLYRYIFITIYTWGWTTRLSWIRTLLKQPDFLAELKSFYMP